MKAMTLYFHDQVFVVEFNGKVAETEDIKRLMKWLIHDLNLKLGDARAVTKMVTNIPTQGVKLAETMSLDAGMELLAKLKEVA